MTGDLDDLLPLFLAEAAERLDRIGELARSLPADREAATRMRRELHALKGAARMMRLGEVSELCHRAEQLLEDPESVNAGELERVVDRLMVRLQNAGHDGPSTPETSTAASETLAAAVPSPGAAASLDGNSVRLPLKDLDELSDRSARLRILAVAAGGLVDRIFELGRLAERGVGERLPEQVLATLATSLRQLALEFESGHRRMQRLADRQLDAHVRLQVQPLRPFLTGLARHARELGDALGKKVDVRVEAGSSQLDRRTISALREVFLHLVRNAVDHGLESPEDRRQAGKPEVGSLRLEASSGADRVRITVADDGCGVDREALVARAVERGVLDPQQADRLSPAGKLDLLFQAGLSTRAEASEISGRGIGFDAVAAAVHRVGGDLWVESTPGAGMTVVIEVPVARRGERLLVVKIGSAILALPAAPIRSFRRLGPGELVEVDGRFLVRRDGAAPVPAWTLRSGHGDGSSERALVIDHQMGGRSLAVVVDEVVGEQEVFVRPFPALAGLGGMYEGMAMLATGRPVAVVSLRGAEVDRVAVPAAHGKDRRRRPLRVLLVDDSPVTREMVRRLLEDGGFEVTAVGSAADALARLGESPFDCLVTDIEMPGLDGLELTRHLRDTPQFADLPVVVVSTRDRPVDRLAGLEAGADAYLTKQSLDARELVALVRRVGGGA